MSNAFRCFAMGMALVLALTTAAQSAPRTELASDGLEAAISVTKVRNRAGRDNLVTVWDGNKYVQCRRMVDRSLRCETAGTLMQTSLERVLTPEHVARLMEMGWLLDPSFGNYVQTFNADMPIKEISDKVRAVLAEAYDADTDNLEIETRTIPSELCPPRNGPSQNLAGIINNARSMAATAIHGCAFKREAGESEKLLPYGSTVADLMNVYGPRVTAEIQRLHINRRRNVYVVFDTGIGYIQCTPETDLDGIYCEAQSADSWPAIASVLTPDRIVHLHKAGFADPGRAPNYSKTYPADKITDAALTAEILTLLHEVYGFYGASKLAFKTDEG